MFVYKQAKIKSPMCKGKNKASNTKYPNIKMLYF